MLFRSRDTRVTAPATFEQAQAQTMGGLASPDFSSPVATQVGTRSTQELPAEISETPVHDRNVYYAERLGQARRRHPNMLRG